MVRLTLDKTLEKKKITRYQLAQMTGIQYQIIDNYYKNKVVRYDSYVLDRVCSALECEISDIIGYEKEQ
ncbi:MAG: helix-turn-helix transcriptional regulator [Clostridia bacterium]|nr:helix-turn-helix transcriptional regulator [Clostridia bacterium]